MLEFEPFSLEALKRVLPYIKQSKSLCSDISAGSLFMWREDYDLRFCVYNDTFILHEKIGDQSAFSWPIGKDVNGMVDELIKYVRANNLALRFCEIDDETLEVIKSDSRLSPVMSAYDSRWSDYVYSFSEAMTFKGNKYKGQRNHINKFKRLYGEPVVRFVEPGDIGRIKNMLSEYGKSHGDANAVEKLEAQNTETLFDIYKDFDMYAACLEVEGEIAAVSIGEVIGDMLILHVEKALTRYEGIYPTMYNGFVNLIAKALCRELKYINREDDAGDEGLRISKLQYHPIGRVNKYLAHVNSPAARIGEFPVIDLGDIVLTEFRESDKPAYLELNTDVENNRYWGYDYREDDEITRIDENTFYDFNAIDMRAGDSVNFAIRLSTDGDMIGEAILWNFKPDFAELGCRIMPQYHGRGYGTAVFKAVAQFAESRLKVAVVAKCFNQNTASYRMIESSGFVKTGADEKYTYFKRSAPQ